MMSYQEEIAAKIKTLSGGRSGAISQEKASFIHAVIIQNNIKRTREIGLGDGFPAAHIIHATQARHYVIEAYLQARHYLGVKNLEALGYRQFLELREDFSHNALLALVKEKKRFELIFIDGGHRYDDIFIDWYYSDLLLDDRGLLLFYDSWMRSTQLVGSFIRKNRSDYHEIKCKTGSLLLFQKRGTDDRPWHHFNEFYTQRGLKSYRNFLIKRASEQRVHIDNEQI